MIEWSDYIPAFELNTVKKGKKEFYKVFLSLDTETSHNHDEIFPVAWVYQWAIRIENDTVVGRTPTQLMTVLERIRDYVYLNGKQARLLCFVHNLSYDLHYLYQYLRDKFGEPEYLATKPHKFIFARFSVFEFRCSYILSNKSLDKWSRDLGTEHRKLVDTVDYSAIHLQDEELSITDWEYMEHDVVVLQECIYAQLKLYKDTLATLPLTSTGYVRRECRKHFKSNPHNRKQFLCTRMSGEVYRLLVREFQGAITHGNRFYAEQTVKGTIKHRDFRSHYPSQQRVRKFATGKFIKYGTNVDLDTIFELMETKTVLINCVIESPRLKDKRITMPYLNKDKCTKGKLERCEQSFILDNGRVLEMTGYTNLVLLDDDLRLIMHQYDIQSFKTFSVYVADKDYLPQFMLDTVDEFMHGKTKYKILAKNETDKAQKQEYELSLMKSKIGLNGIYGCTAQKSIQPTVKRDEDSGEYHLEECSPERIEEMLDKFYDNPKSFMRYIWGCQTTLYGRLELLEYCELIGYENVLYCDTDSAFYISTPEIEERIEQRNKEKYEHAKSIGAFIDYEGQEVSYDVFELEPENITQFRFLHAKCYAYTTDDSELHLTIAGVSDRESPTSDVTREVELGDIENLKSGFVFEKCGGTTAVYPKGVIKPFLYDYKGHILECSEYVIIKETTKTLHNEIDRENIYYDFNNL